MGCVSPSLSDPPIRLSTSLQQSCSRGRAGQSGADAAMGSAAPGLRGASQRAAASRKELGSQSCAFVLQGGSCTQQELPGEEGQVPSVCAGGGRRKAGKAARIRLGFCSLPSSAAQCSNYYFSLECLFQSIWITLYPRVDFSKATYHTPFITWGSSSAPCSQWGRMGHGWSSSGDSSAPPWHSTVTGSSCTHSSQHSRA